jgi:hypothetical protein
MMAVVICLVQPGSVQAVLQNKDAVRVIVRCPEFHGIRYRSRLKRERAHINEPIVQVFLYNYFIFHNNLPSVIVKQGRFL